MKFNYIEKINTLIKSISAHGFAPLKTTLNDEPKSYDALLVDSFLDQITESLSGIVKEAEMHLKEFEMLESRYNLLNDADRVKLGETKNFRIPPENIANSTSSSLDKIKRLSRLEADVNKLQTSFKKLSSTVSEIKQYFYKLFLEHKKNSSNVLEPKDKKTF